ncbi:MAG: hypothetical protein K6A65_09305 [Succinivibrionaceae bacterium]|nr:hypothetical protein [Succinivibrionaceae bacterium]
MPNLESAGQSPATPERPALQGTISSFDHETSHGHIQAADGRILRFTVASLQRPEDSDCLVVGMPCRFGLGPGGEAEGLCFDDPESFLELNSTYSVPGSLELRRETYPEGYEIIARSGKDIFRVARRPEVAVAALRKAAEDFGANVILRYRVERFKKAAMGYAFWFHRAYGTPAVIGRKDPSGTHTLEDLRSRLDTGALQRETSTQENLERGKVVLRWLAAALLLTFSLGFAYAKWFA